MKFFGYFKDGAIVQRSRPVLVRGRADGEVTCSLIGGKYKERRTVSPEAGKFSVFFPPVEDTESEFLLFAECSGKRISARLRFGDVYLALGQSNMNYCLSATEDYEKWLKRTKDCRISLLKLEEKPVPEGTQLSGAGKRGLKIFPPFACRRLRFYPNRKEFPSASWIPPWAV